MRILLDPSRDSCTIYNLSRDTIQFLKGTSDEICKKVYMFCTYEGDFGIRKQSIDIVLDNIGIGQSYEHILEKIYGLKISTFQFEKELLL